MSYPLGQIFRPSPSATLSDHRHSCVLPKERFVSGVHDDVRMPSSKDPPMTDPCNTADSLEIRIGVSRRVRPMDVLPPAGYPAERPYRWSEKTVLKRWRKRTATASGGTVYRGSRLPPSLWALIAGLRMLESDLASLDDAALTQRINQVRAEAGERGEFLAYVAPGILRALFDSLSPNGRLDAMLEAHADGSHGVPDLFLFKERTGKTVDAVFVEVKRHGEAILEEQLAEITRLRARGLHAGVFRFNREPRGPRERLRKARSRLFPNREERHLGPD